MRVVKFVGFGNELLVKPFLTDTRFIASDHQNRVAFWIERKGDPQYPIGRIRPKFLRSAARRG